jgi:DNA-binding CsgD family transcriptional regulator
MRSRVLGLRGGYLTRRCVKHRNLGRVRPRKRRFSQRQRATIERIIRALAAERPRRWHSASCIAEQLGVSGATVSSTLAAAFKVPARRRLPGEGGLVRRKHRAHWLYSFTPVLGSPRTPRLEVQMIRRDNCVAARTPCEARAWRKALTEGSGQGFLVDPLMLGAGERGPAVLTRREVVVSR